MRLLLYILGLIALAAPVFAQSPAGPARSSEQITVELTPMSAWAAPGSTAIVALRQQIAPGWHTYWRNPGDSGGPTSLSWTLPRGASAGEIVWPLPERQRLQSFVNYGYSGEVFLPVPIQVPANATGALPIKARVDLFVCSDQLCIPWSADLALDLPVRSGAAPLARHGRAIERVLAEAPREGGLAATAALEDGRWRLAVTGGALKGGRLTQAWFYPFEADVIDHAAAQVGERGAEGLTLTLPAAADARTGSLAGVLATNLGAFEITAAPGPAPAGAQGAGALQPFAGVRPAGGAGAAVGWLQAAGLAFLGGLILNLMPCVFPILAMKAAALAGAAHDPGRARRDGIAFVVGVLSAFLALAGVLLAARAAGQAVGWGFQLQAPAVTAGLALLMLAVGLNLSGVFHMGAGVQGAGHGPLARLPGAAGAFMTGVLAVVVAAPCTAPFMATALGAALVTDWPVALLIFALLGLGLALPYLIVSLWPAALRRLPRPGAWMERLKGLLAFPMYGAALWLAWVFARQAGPDALALLFTAGLALALAAWLAGKGQARAAEGGGAIVHLTAAAAVLVIALAATAAGVRIARPLSEETAPAGALPSQPWSEAAVAQALADRRPVLVNFTADWCVTCKLNERTVFSSPRVAEAIAGANAVYLVADWTRRDDAVTRALQSQGRSGVPLYLLYRPGEPEPRLLPQLLTEGAVVRALKGTGERP